MGSRDFALPDLGEGLTESELVSWHVAVGDTVELNQPLADVETAKALVELPSPFAGVITKLYAEPGTTVLVGAPIVAFELEGFDGDDGKSTGKPEREPMLVGYGPPVEGGGRPARKARKGQGPAAATVPPELSSKVELPSPVEQTPSPEEAEGRLEGSQQESPRSTPPVRKLAADLGVDLRNVTGTGEKGLITREDVHAAAASPVEPGFPVEPVETRPSTLAQRKLDGLRESRTPIKGVRKFTAAAMVSSAFTAPHASEFLTIDVTPTMELIATLRESRAFAGKRLNLLTVVAKALCIAAARNPAVNSRWDDPAQEIVEYHYVNLGIAAATPRGLMVPNIKNADSLDLAGLADALGALIETAKQGTSSPAELGGGTISITNIGSFGIDAGTPILNPGEAMILAMGAVKRMPWECRGEIALRQVMTLSVSFDHRLVDGEQGSRFLADVGAILANPAVLLTMV